MNWGIGWTGPTGQLAQNKSIVQKAHENGFVFVKMVRDVLESKLSLRCVLGLHVPVGE